MPYGRIVFGGNATQLVANLKLETLHKVWGCEAKEHSCVTSLCRFYNMPSPDELGKSYGPENIYFKQLLNNVTGEVFDIPTIWRQVNHHNNTFLAVDITAAIGKTDLSCLKQNCDILFWSGHKIHTPVGIGCMWLSDDILSGTVKYDKLQGLCGTPSVENARLICEATEKAIANTSTFSEHAQMLYDYFIQRMKATGLMMPPSYENKESVFNPAIFCVRVPGANADALQQFLALRKIYVGLGASACAESHDYRVLEAYGVSQKDAQQIIRISVGEDTTTEDIDRLFDEVDVFRRKFI